jgi:hypothetical protein
MRMASHRNEPSILNIFTPSTTSTTPAIDHNPVERSFLNSKVFDVAFTRLSGCGDEYTCNITRLLPLYRFSEAIPFSDSHKWKLLLDIDGQAYSGRFLSLLKMGSAVMKSTIYEEFFTDYLIPWVHVIPVSLGYEEIYNTYAYFLGIPDDVEDDERLEGVWKNENGLEQNEEMRKLLKDWKEGQGMNGASEKWKGDREGLKKIAEEGKEWSKKVSTRASMEAYT